MSILITRRRLTAFVTAVAAVTLVRPARAAALPSPQEKVYLTISGKIANTNKGDTAVFDRPMLEALGYHSIETTTPWYNGAVRFEGVLMQNLMERVGATGDTVRAVALNDFATEIPMSDFAHFGVLLALKRNGEYMPIRDKGPLFIVYPYNSDEELRSQKYYSRSAWQLSQLIVK